MRYRTALLFMTSLWIGIMAHAQEIGVDETLERIMAVEYRRDAHGIALSGSEAAMREREILPLLYVPATTSGAATLVCGACPCNAGFAIFRPKELTGPASLAGQGGFETNLVQFSLNPTREGWPSFDPRRNLRRRPPTGRRRTTR